MTQGFYERGVATLGMAGPVEPTPKPTVPFFLVEGESRPFL